MSLQKPERFQLNTEIQPNYQDRNYFPTKHLEGSLCSVAHEVPTVHQDMSACPPDISQMTHSNTFSKDFIMISTITIGFFADKQTYLNYQGSFQPSANEPKEHFT